MIAQSFADPFADLIGFLLIILIKQNTNNLSIEYR